jgi:hypothetical protein
MPTQEKVDFNQLSELLQHGAQSIKVDTGDQTVTLKSKTVGTPVSKNQRNQAGQMQSQDMISQILNGGQGGSPLGDALQGLAQKLGLAGGSSQPGKGAGMLNELAGFIANNFGRSEMGTQHMGGGQPELPLPDALQMAASANGGAPTTPEMGGAPVIPPGAGSSQDAMGLLGTMQQGGGGGMPPDLAGLLGPIMAAAGQGAPGPMPPMPGGGMPGGGMGPEGVPPLPPVMGEGSMPPELAAMLGIPGRAAGGPVEAGQPYVVGEEGPEVMVPDQSGDIIPNPGSVGGASEIEGQVSTIIDEVIRIAEERGISLLGPDGNMSPEAISIFIEVLQGSIPSQEAGMDPLASQIGGGTTPEPGSDPLVGGMMSGAGGGAGAPMLDGLGGGAMSPDMTGGTPSGPDDIQALLAALGG